MPTLGCSETATIQNMATLRTTTNLFVRGSATLELTPNSPSQSELVDTYSVRLWIHDQLIYDQIQSVRDWQMRHFYVEEIARAFCCCHELLGQEIQCSPGNGPESQQPSFLSLANAKLSTDWLTVVLAATRVKRIGDLVHVDMYLRKAQTTIGDYEHRSTGQWGEWAEMVAAIIFCTPDEAASFGRQLLEEIRKVEQERVALGIPEFDDPSRFE
jgi:hypothetical protein